MTLGRRLQVWPRFSQPQSIQIARDDCKSGPLCQAEVLDGLAPNLRAYRNSVRTVNHYLVQRKVSLDNFAAAGTWRDLRGPPKKRRRDLPLLRHDARLCANK
jgi:hypothetical protein